MLTEKNMLTTPARPTSLSRNQSFESPPCPPYNQEDVLAHAPVSEEDELWAELERIKDARALREKFYAEHQLMREQLNMAGRFGLDLQQSLEQAQRAEQQSYAQIQALQDENLLLQSRAHHSRELASHLTGSQDEVMNLTNEKDTLQRELDGCRRELKMFRKELDGLVEQMTEMGTEVLDAKAKVSHYSRRLNEVEQELGATQELNVNLQEQLHVAVEKQKQAQSSTAQAVKNMQSELGKVISDKGTILSTLEELENRQDKCEGRVVEMMTNTQEYAQLLEEAQTTIQTLRIESEMEGRGWTQPSPSKRSVIQLATLASEDPELQQPEFEVDEEQQVEVVMSLGIELGFGNPIDNDDEQMVSSPVEMEAPAKVVVDSPAPSTPAPSTATSPLPPVADPQKKQKPVVEPQPEPQPQPQPQPQPAAQNPTPSELHQRLEEHNILQTVLSSPGQSRPPWNPSVALENTMPTPTQNRSRSTSRASSRSTSRSVSQVSLRHLGSPSPSSTSTVRNNSSIHSRTSVMPSPQMSPHSMSTTSSSSLMDAISARSGKRDMVSASSSSSLSSAQSRPRSRTTATTVEKSHVDKNPNPGLKFLATKNGATTDPSNVITKTKTATPKPIKPIKSTTSPSAPTNAAGRTRATSAQPHRWYPCNPDWSINRGASPSIPVSPSPSTVTQASHATTTSSSPIKDTSRPSFSPSPSPFESSPPSPSNASKQLKAMAEESSGTGSRRSSVTSSPLPLPVPSTTTETVTQTTTATSGDLAV
ncbi:hypothetical protein BGX29_006718 [Mortierella sp. GBA35]|nr:hypothetical protein BGX29_006718 [Mortierella sp. GBA35]